ncbi:hypothetical protein [Streptomyces sp. STR69]|uniref:hypothetical protein n=1 Tax=Streptomyces sp. STR69 TaxID=1796942 RepID=UPI0021C6E477|nr:hypothetical protein [Streptomyces sp. STR69]
MIFFILAAALGANTVIVLLLFRRLRQDLAQSLSRQVTAIRVEITRDRVIRQLTDTQGRAGGEQEPTEAIALAIGAESEPEAPPPQLQPIRRKGHLGLYIGGAMAMVVTALARAAREALRIHRRQSALGILAAAAATTTTVTVLTLTPWVDGSDIDPPPAVPSVALTAFPDPGHTAPGSSTTNPSLASTIGPRRTGGPSSDQSLLAAVGGRLTPVDDSAAPSPTPSAGTTPVESPTQAVTAAPTENPTQSSSSPTSSTACTGLSVAVLDVQACLLGGGDG